MKIIKQSCNIESITPQLSELIEKAGRICYQTESGSIPPADFITKRIVGGHESIIEHGNMTVRFITDRGVTHELVRHRLAAYSQESTRYCNYSNEKFGNELTFIWPVWFTEAENDQNNIYDEGFVEWEVACQASEDYYFRMLEIGQSPQQARTVLNNSLKTEIIMTANMREWRHVLKLRTSAAAHPQIRALMQDLLIKVQTDPKLLVFFINL
jgi:thymidylate synthase (FAD)